MSRTILHCLKNVRVIEVRRYIRMKPIWRSVNFSSDLNGTKSVQADIIITKTRLFKYIENFTTKN